MPSTSSNASKMANSTKDYITPFQREIVHRKLLYDLMSSIYEYILICNEHETNRKSEGNTSNRTVPSTPNMDILLLNIHSCLEQIFLNGLRLFKLYKSPDIWGFIEALNWINPLLMCSITSKMTSKPLFVAHSAKNARIRSNKALAWIYENIQSHQLETKLIYLLSDAEHLQNSYDVTVAFFHNKKFVDALFICLSAFDKGDYNLLTRIDKNLYIGAIDESIRDAIEREAKSDEKKASKNGKMSTKKLRKHANRIRNKLKHCINMKMRPWVSLPEIRQQSKSENQMASRMFRLSSQPIYTNHSKSSHAKLTVVNLAIKDKQKVPTIRANQRKISNSLCHDQCNHSNDGIDELRPINLVKCDDIKIHLDRRIEFSYSSFQSTEFSLEPKSNLTSTNMLKSLPSKTNLLPFLSTSHGDASGSPINKQTSNSAPADFASFFTPTGAKIENRYNSTPVLENIQSQSPLISYKCSKNNRTMLPRQGQSLTSYLQKVQRSRTNITDLERENAHFNLSDAIISAIEEVKCTRMERKKEKLMKLAVKNRKSRQRPKLLKNWVVGEDNEQHESDIDLMENDDVSGSASEMATSSRTSSSDSDLSHISSNSDTSAATNAGDLKCLKSFNVSTHSINDHSAYAEWAENTTETLSAEGIAVSLISKFKDYQLPLASDLLVCANDQFNAMNRVFDIAPERIYQVPYTRGTPDWTPPRAQIIFTRHPPTDRRSLLEIQKYRCAGCGMRVDVALAHSLRYCDYLGKYHCTGCHRNQISSIPARVLDRWDFTCHPVCVFSYRLLDQIWKIPLFRVPDLNKELYSKVRSLRYCRLRRLQLKYVHDFVQTCRFADDDGAKHTFDNIPSHIYNDVEVWSMSDFVGVRNGNFLKIINEIIVKGEEHVFNCELCTAHGFICEYCSCKQVIFPWQLKVIRCKKCGSCSHSECSTDQCQKCQRLEKRSKQ